MKTKDKSELSYLLGKAVALEQIGPRLLRDAGEAFSAGNDDKAKWLREMSQTFKNEASNARQSYWDAGGDAGK